MNFMIDCILSILAPNYILISKSFYKCDLHWKNLLNIIKSHEEKYDLILVLFSVSPCNSNFYQKMVKTKFMLVSETII